MGPKYKLTYFDCKGLAEAIRFLFSHLQLDWEDNRVEISSPDEWLALKHKTPWGTLPILEVDGKVLTQSKSILRYLGRTAGLAGDNDWESTQIDMIADTIDVDLRIPASTFMWESNESVKKTKKETWLKETFPFYMQKLESVVKENGGYLANGKLSWADFLFAGISEYLSYNADVADVTADFPNLHALRQRIITLPHIAKWIDKRPTTPF